MLHVKGIIFDFNGTMFYDTDKHEQSWIELLKHLCDVEITPEFCREHVHGKPNSAIFRDIYKKDISESKLAELSLKKELRYHELCLADTEHFCLAPGLVPLLDRLSENSVPMTIATGSGKENLDFYIEHFGLEKWFDIGKIVYNDGTMRGKPHPDIYLRAAKNLCLKPEECLVLEDAKLGIESAQAAGASAIIAVRLRPQYDYVGDAKGIYTTISDFSQLDRLAVRWGLLPDNTPEE